MWLGRYSFHFTSQIYNIWSESNLGSQYHHLNHLYCIHSFWIIRLLSPDGRMSERDERVLWQNKINNHPAIDSLPFSQKTIMNERSHVGGMSLPTGTPIGEFHRCPGYTCSRGDNVKSSSLLIHSMPLLLVLQYISKTGQTFPLKEYSRLITGQLQAFISYLHSSTPSLDPIEDAI